MTSDDIRKALHSNLPFKVRTDDGKVLDVPHQDFAALSRNGLTLVVMTPDTVWEMVDVRLITSIETPNLNSAT